MGRLSRSEYYKIFSVLFSLISFSFSPILSCRRERNVASDSAILESDLKDCAGSQKELDEISSGITVYRVFLQRARLCEEKGFLQLANGKIVVFLSFLFLSHFSFSPSTAFIRTLEIATTFFLGFFLFVSWFSLMFNESYPVSARTKDRRNHPMCRCNTREILSGYAF